MAQSVKVQRFIRNEHFEQVLQLYDTVFGPQSSRAFAARWRWAQEENLLSSTNPCWVLVADEKVLGFLGTVGQELECGNKTLVASSTADYMVDPGTRFHGLKLMKEFMKTCDNSISLEDVPDTMAVLKWLKCETIGEMQRFVKILDPRSVSRYWPPLAKIPNLLMRPAREVLNGLNRATSWRLPKVVQLALSDGRFDQFAEQMGTRFPVRVKHDARYLSWRYGPDSPHEQPVVGGVLDDNGHILGFVVADIRFDEQHTGHIFEMENITGDAKIFMALLKFAARQLRKKNAWVLQFHRLNTNANISQRDLGKLGFSARSARYHVMVRMTDQEAREIAGDINNWHYSFGDGEPSHSIPYNPNQNN